MANDFFLIDTPLAENIKKIANTSSLPKNDFQYDTPLGVSSHCYQGQYFLILSKNDTGNGYEFSNIKPKNVKCITLPDKMTMPKNLADMHLGMVKKQVITLLNMPKPSDKATLMYNQKKTIKGKILDEQTWLDVEFQQEKLTRISVFVSITQ